jgi:hypothetical protein
LTRQSDGKTVEETTASPTMTIPSVNSDPITTGRRRFNPFLFFNLLTA